MCILARVWVVSLVSEISAGEELPSTQKSSVKIWTMGKKHALLRNSGAWKTVELVSLVFGSLPLLRQAEVSQRSFAAGNLHQSPDPCPGCLLVTVRTSGYVSLEFSSSVRVFCNPMNCSPPGSSVYATSQARILEWVAISSSRGSSRAWDRTHIPCISRRILYHWASPETSCRPSVNINDQSGQKVADPPRCYLGMGKPKGQWMVYSNTDLNYFFQIWSMILGMAFRGYMWFFSFYFYLFTHLILLHTLLPWYQKVQNAMGKIFACQYY